MAHSAATRRLNVELLDRPVNEAAELAQALKQIRPGDAIFSPSSNTLDIPVLVVTARDLTEENRRRLSGGVERIIPKRVYDCEELLREVAHLLGASATFGAPPGEERPR